MSLAHFGFDNSKRQIDDRLLPLTLSSEWLEDEEVKGKPYPTYAKMLPEKSESRYSWNIDFAARRAEAKEKVEPHKVKVVELREENLNMKEQLKGLKKEKKSKEEIEALKSEIDIKDKEIREHESIISDIDAKVFDLKAVNPNAVLKVDKRTSIEVIENIEKQSKIVASAMNKLKNLLK